MALRALDILKGALLVSLATTLLACASNGVDTPGRELELQPQPARPSTGPPTTWRLILQLEDNQLRVLRADPRRGSVKHLNPRELRTDFLERKSRLIAYSAQAADGTQVLAGWIVVPQVAIAEFQHLEEEEKLQREEELLVAPTTRVAIPYDRRTRTIVFEALEPDPKLDFEAWKRTTVGKVELPSQNDEPEGGQR